MPKKKKVIKRKRKVLRRKPRVSKRVRAVAVRRVRRKADSGDTGADTDSYGYEEFELTATTKGWTPRRRE